MEIPRKITTSRTLLLGWPNWASCVSHMKIELESPRWARGKLHNTFLPRREYSISNSLLMPALALTRVTMSRFPNMHSKNSVNKTEASTTPFGGSQTRIQTRLFCHKEVKLPYKYPLCVCNLSFWIWGAFVSFLETLDSLSFFRSRIRAQQSQS